MVLNKPQPKDAQRSHSPTSTILAGGVANPDRPSWHGKCSRSRYKSQQSSTALIQFSVISVQSFRAITGRMNLLGALLTVLGLQTLALAENTGTGGSAKRRSALLVHAGDNSLELGGLKAFLSRPDSEVVLAKVTSIKNLAEASLVDPHTDGLRYDNLILLAGTLPRKVKHEEFVEFVKRGGNIFWALPSEMPAGVDEATRRLAADFGRMIDSEPAHLTDFFDGEARSTGRLPVRPSSACAPRVFSSDLASARFPGGFPHHLDPDNPLVFPILTAREHSVSTCKGSSKCHPALGTNNIIASALESRINSRVTIVTGDEPLNQAVTLPLFMQDLLSWALGEKGLLKLNSFEHHSNPERTDGFGYRASDQLNVRVCLTGKTAAGMPFQQVQPDDVQLVVKELHVERVLTMIPDKEGCLVTGPFTVPERIEYGVITLRVRYQRRGWSHILHEERILLRGPTSWDVPRFKLGALPYYSAWIVMMFSSALLLLPLIVVRNHDHLKHK